MIMPMIKAIREGQVGIMHPVKITKQLNIAKEYKRKWKENSITL